MRYEISADLFVAANHVAIMSLLDRSARGRLYLAVPNPSPNYEGWLAQLRMAERDQWATMLEWSELDATSHRTQSIKVENIPASQWEQKPPRLTLTDASKLADHSVEVLLENGRNDRAFLLAMAGTQRAYLSHLEDAGALTFSGEGGIGEMKARIRDQLATRNDRTVRFFSMFDSDADVPGCPSAPALAVVELCAGANIPHHCLERRAIENYMPTGALFDFAQASSKAVRVSRRKLAAAIKEMTLDQRCHFPMKSGLPDSLTREQSSLFGVLDPPRGLVLRTGFGDRLAALYSEGGSHRLLAQIEADSAKDEVRKVIENILYLARAPHA